MRAAILLAAGRSERFGRADKMFARLDGVPLLLHAIRVAKAAPAVRLIVVARRPARVRALVAGMRGVRVVPVGQAGAPLSVSLAAGIAALRPVERDAFLFLGDMPALDPALAGRLVRRLRPGLVAVRPWHRGAPGHPVLVRNIRAVPRGSGDAGLRPPRERVGWIAGGPTCVVDVDSGPDLKRARRARIVRRA